jgi:hypothetical protein
MREREGRWGEEGNKKARGEGKGGWGRGCKVECYIAITAARSAWPVHPSVCSLSEAAHTPAPVCVYVCVCVCVCAFSVYASVCVSVCSLF